MSKVKIPAISINTQAVVISYLSSNEEHWQATGLFATPNQSSLIASQCSIALSSIGEISEYVEVIKAIFILPPYEKFREKPSYFKIYAVVNCTGRVETKAIMINTSGDTLESNDFSKEISALIIDSVKESVRSCRSNADFFEEKIPK